MTDGQLANDTAADRAVTVLPPGTAQRLAFITYLLRIGVEQSRQPEPLAAASVLTLHDSIELFLRLASERFNVGSERTGFMQYFELIDEALVDRQLGQKEPVRRLNSARVALKHHGTMPSRLDIEMFRATAGSFFAENTPMVFGVAPDQVSLASLVANELARASLEAADRHRAAGELEHALEEIGVAFARLVDAHGLSRYTGVRGGLFARRLDYLPTGFNDPVRPLADYVSEVGRNLHALENEVGLQRHGINTLRYDRFRQLTPDVVIAMAGNVRLAGSPSPRPTRMADVSFCYDFVIDVALRLQADEALGFADGA
jgi:hypothetical protein